jgi:hypothetical protein
MIKLKSLLREEAEELSSISQITDDVKVQLATAAQSVYDEWSQDEEGNDLEVGAGGICDGIADALVDVLSSHGMHDIQTQYNEPHTYVIGRFREGIFTIDIPYSLYESGYLYTWKKKPNVKFEPSHIEIYQLDADSGKWKQYTDYD